jgi:hypothetical protein
VVRITSSVPPLWLLHLINPVVRRLLQGPLHSIVSGAIVLAEYRGQKTGNVYQSPISYRLLDGAVTAFSGAPWTRNLKTGDEVDLILQGRRRRTRVEVVEEPAAVANGLYRIMQEIGPRRLGFWFGFDIRGLPQPADIQAALTGRRMMRFIL